MFIFDALVRRFRHTKATAISEPDMKMVELAEKLAEKRGDNVTPGVAQPGENVVERLASSADLLGIVTSTREDKIISGG
ncbi:hypothetical protein N9P45_01450 [bacterium]|nr:hypothetical protein [bacterium]